MQNSITNKHFPVLLNEAINYLPKKNKLSVIDATFGGGGYSKLILKKNNVKNLIALDCDPLSKKFIYNFKQNNNFKFIEGKFSDLDLLVQKTMKNLNLPGFDAIFFDLGLSSNQIEDSERGFSFSKDGPLDMRMSQNGITAFEVINRFSEKDIANIIYKYGEERFAKSIAKKIIQYRNKKQIDTTFELSFLINQTKKTLNKKKYKKNYATKTFQALRIYINNELDEINKGLRKSLKLLLPGGRIIIVSFHSLEDRLVKEFFNHNSGKKWRSSRHYPESSNNGPITLKIITKKAIRPDKNEIITNPRSRSARLRVAEKIEYEVK